MRKLEFKVTQELDSKTVQNVLSHYGVSRRLIIRQKRAENGITNNGMHCRVIDTVKEGDIITLALSDEKTLESADALSVPVIFEDDYVIVFDKPAFMPVHPSFKHQGDTLGNFFSKHCKGLTFRAINRLDRDTSGLCAVAKNSYCATLLQKNIDKTYYAIAEGTVLGKGTIDAPIARLNSSIIRRCVDFSGQPAITHYEAVDGGNLHTLLKIKLETGRTHQIRVHFAYRGHPLAGDDMYGGSVKYINRQALHCGELVFTHPVTKNIIRLKSDIPQDMQSVPLYL